jgi:predicted regulator of Ras-like GTPase activity (Roadblock/LC7/MglB family)
MSGTKEAPRDQTESAFTPILRALWTADPSVAMVCFVDRDGECIDYCSSASPFDAKVLGAHMTIIVDDVVRRSLGLGFGHPHSMHLACSDREILVRRLSDQYAIVVATAAGGVGRAVLRALEEAVEALRREGGIDVPVWEPYEAPLEVEVRGSVGSPYAPVAFWRHDERTPVTDVIGWWLDEDEGWICFRVRIPGNREVTLAHNPETNRWFELTLETEGATG